MAGDVRYPSLYQINARVWLGRLSWQLGKRVTLKEVPDDELDRIAALGFDWVWLLSVWQTSAASRAVSRSQAGWREEFRRTLPDLTEDDICGSGFAITGYMASTALGGAPALADIRRRLATRGLKLMLDHVPNHTGLDHPWIETHPDYFVPGSEQDCSASRVTSFAPKRGRVRASSPMAAIPISTAGPTRYSSTTAIPIYRTRASPNCLISPANATGFAATWRCSFCPRCSDEPGASTWRRSGRGRSPGFANSTPASCSWRKSTGTWNGPCSSGFDYCYDERLYDRLRDGRARPVRDHLVAPLDYQDRLARFLENHDEPRAAATFDLPQHRAAAAVTFLAPGLRFFQDGQFDGRRVHISTHLCRAPDEPIDAEVRAFYEKLLAVLGEDVVRNGDWRRLEPEPAGPDNASFDNVIGCVWRGQNGGLLLVVVNYSNTQSQCRLRLSFDELRNKRLRLADRLGEEVYDRDGTELLAPGLFIDHAPWHVNVFSISTT